MLDRADYTDFGCHNSIRLKAEHFLNTVALTFISFSGRFTKTLSFFLASDPLVKRPARDACLCMGELPAPPALPAPHFVFLITL